MNFNFSVSNNSSTKYDVFKDPSCEDKIVYSTMHINSIYKTDIIVMFIVVIAIVFSLDIYSRLYFLSYIRTLKLLISFLTSNEILINDS